MEVALKQERPALTIELVQGDRGVFDVCIGGRLVFSKKTEGRFPSAADLDRALGRCGCAADWSAERAAEWWQQRMGQEQLSGPNKWMQLTGTALWPFVG